MGHTHTIHVKVVLAQEANQLGVHPDTLRRLAYAGKIKFTGTTQGGQRLFDLNGISQVIKSEERLPKLSL